MVCEVKARAQVGEDFIVEFAATEMPVEVGAGEPLCGGNMRLGNVVSRNDGCVGRRRQAGKLGWQWRKEVRQWLRNATTTAADRLVGRNAASWL